MSFATPERPFVCRPLRAEVLEACIVVSVRGRFPVTSEFAKILRGVLVAFTPFASRAKEDLARDSRRMSQLPVSLATLQIEKRLDIVEADTVLRRRHLIGKLVLPIGAQQALGVLLELLLREWSEAARLKDILMGNSPDGAPQPMSPPSQSRKDRDEHGGEIRSGVDGEQRVFNATSLVYSSGIRGGAPPDAAKVREESGGFRS